MLSPIPYTLESDQRSSHGWDEGLIYGPCQGASTAVGEVIHQGLLESGEADASFSACPARTPTRPPPCQLDRGFLQSP